MGGFWRAFGALCSAALAILWTGPAESAESYPDFESRYVTMRDGVRLAVDIALPPGLKPGARVPAILHQTKYFRRLDIVFPFGGVDAERRREAERFVAAGYAWINVDVRGSGASFGVRPADFAAAEIGDGRDLVDWIVAQPWSNGRVGATGVSYPAAAADHLATLGHPAVKAIAPRYIYYDAYTDLFFPGGIPLGWFIGRYDEITSALDRDALGGAIGLLYGAVIEGVAPVDGADGRRLRAAALGQRSGNWKVAAALSRIQFRDDRGADGQTFEAGSAYAKAAAVRQAGIPVYSWSGWFDGAYVNGAVRRHLTIGTPGSRLRIGPWPHAGTANISPQASSDAPGLDETGAAIAFFDRYVKDGASPQDPPQVDYYEMGAEVWRRSPHWPPPGVRMHELHAVCDGGLSGTAGPAGADTYTPADDATTGSRSRWRSIINPTDEAIGYPGWTRESRRRLAYETPPLAAPATVAGHPVVTVVSGFDARDADVFVYLEDVAADGEIRYVTEGQLRASHRRLAPGDMPRPYAFPAAFRTFARGDSQPLTPGEAATLVFDLLPTAYRFAAASRIRLSFAATDVDNFSAFPDPPVWTVRCGGGDATRLALPLMAETPELLFAP